MALAMGLRTCRFCLSDAAAIRISCGHASLCIGACMFFGHKYGHALWSLIVG